MNAPVSKVKSLGDRQVAARLLFLELASVGPLEQVGIRRSGNESDDVEAQNDAVCGRALWKTRQRLNRRDASMRETRTYGRGSSAACPASGRRSTRRGHPGYRFRSGMRLRARNTISSLVPNRGEQDSTRNRLTRNGALGLTTRVVGQPRDGRRQTAVAVWARRR